MFRPRLKGLAPEMGKSDVKFALTFVKKPALER
jgi:hypothetical protein